VVERVRGRVQFGDGTAGMVPPPGPGNVRATYRAGGGAAGNVAAGKVSSLLGAVPGVQRVFNPAAAAGGADGELAPGRPDAARALLARGPQLVRHRYRAVTAADYEQLALTASPGVAAARAVTPADTRAAVPAGTVRVIVVPAGKLDGAPPALAPTLLERVRAYLQVRAAAGVRVEVVLPDYFPVGVEAVLVPTDPTRAGALTRDARAAIVAFLHPVTGGPDGTGWGTARTIRRSALVARLHRDLGGLLAYAEDVRFLVDGVPVADQVDVPPDRFPTAGSVRVRPGAAGEVCR
jgi:predicted phage baseplate assembly protein